MASKWGGAGAGALSGVTTGAAIGSIIPGLGTGIGAAIGAGVGALSGYFGTKDDKYKQLPTRTPEQQKGLSQIFSQMNQMSAPGGVLDSANQYFQSLLSGDPEAMNRFAAPYMQRFEQQVLPRLANRFAGMGGAHGGGAIGSSGFAQALGGAGSDLQAQLAQLYSSLQSGAASNVQGQYNQLAQLGLNQQPFENIYERGTTGPMGGLSAGLAQGAGQVGGNQLMQQLMQLMQQKNQAPQNTAAPGPTAFGIG